MTSNGTPASSQLPPNQEELISEIRSFLQSNPPKKRLSQTQIDDLLLANSEIYLEIKRERKARKNKNFISSNLINLVAKFEKNLGKLSRSIPVGQSYDSETFDAAKLYFQSLHKRKNYPPQSQNNPRPAPPNIPPTQIKPTFSKPINNSGYEQQHHYPPNPNMMRSNLPSINYTEYPQNQGKYIQQTQGFHQTTNPILKQGYMSYNNNQEFQGNNLNNMGNMNMNAMSTMGQMNSMKNMSLGNMNQIGNPMNLNNMGAIGNMANLNNMGNAGNMGNMGNMGNNMENLGNIGNPNNMTLNSLNNMGHISMNSYGGNYGNMQASGYGNNMQPIQMQGYPNMAYESYQGMGMGDPNLKEETEKRNNI